MSRIDWPPVFDHAAAWVRGFGGNVTLRQVFYHLVSEQLIPNKQTAYIYLSKKTAEGRREGWFPRLIDKTRHISRVNTVNDVRDSLVSALDEYRLDRTEGQEYQVWLGAEKRGMTDQLWSWFSDLGFPIVGFGGYVSQTMADNVAGSVSADGRPAVFIYAGDFDPSGIDIPRDFEERTYCWDVFERVALNPDHVDLYNLPENPGKTSDSRSGRFIAEFGRLVQVEVDALDPRVLRDLYRSAIDEFWDEDAHSEVVEREDTEAEILSEFIDRFDSDE